MAVSLNQSGQRRKALVLFGSETGNAQDIAEDIGRMCERLRFATRVVELDAVDVRQLLRHSIVIFAISTTGQGDLPANSQRFWKTLRSVKLPPGCLRSVKFTSFGLGDSSYPKFNWAHRKLYNRIIQLGGRSICNRGESDEQYLEGIDGTFVPWSLDLRRRLLEEFPLAEGEDPIPDDVVLEPKWILESADVDSLDRNRPGGDQDNVALRNGAAGGEPDAPPTDLIPISNGITATVHSNERITPNTHFQDVRHLIFTLPGEHEYPPGATLTLYPKNFPTDVSQFLDQMSWSSIADKPLKFISTEPNADLSTYSRCPIPFFPREQSLTLRKLLTNHLDIMSIPRRSFFTHLTHYTDDPTHLERLQEFTSPDLLDELYDYTTRPRRSILETLDDFPSVKLPWQKICAIIPLMRGRQFSIASGGITKSATSLVSPNPHAYPYRPEEEPSSSSSPSSTDTRVDLLVAIVKYRTIMKRIRHGVATRYTATLRPGQTVTVTLQRGSLGGGERIDLRRPVVMVGPGTGVAPMRSLAWERKQWRDEDEDEDGAAAGAAAVTASGEAKRRVRDLLFFGCRKAGVDQYFADEWEGLDVDVWVAFSREQREKVYVQDLVRQQSKRVFEALAERGGIVFVCGSSGRMPQAVREALTEVFQTEGGMMRADAEGYLSRMEKEGRYKQETW